MKSVLVAMTTLFHLNYRWTSWYLTYTQTGLLLSLFKKKKLTCKNIKVVFTLTPIAQRHGQAGRGGGNIKERLYIISCAELKETTAE